MIADFGTATATLAWAVLSIAALTASALTAFTVGTLRGGRQGAELFLGLAILSIIVPGALVWVVRHFPPGAFDFLMR